MGNKLTSQDLSILKYYKEGKELSGFEGVHDNLRNLDYLDGDLELTGKGYKFIKEFEKWDEVVSFNNINKIDIKPKLV